MSSITKFLSEVKEEVRHVSWPSREQVIRLSLAVAIVSGVVGLCLGLVDMGLTRLISLVLPS